MRSMHGHGVTNTNDLEYSRLSWAPKETLPIVLELLEFSFPRLPRGAVFPNEPTEFLTLLFL